MREPGLSLRRDAPVLLLVLLSLVLHGVGIRWGLPGVVSWAPDEVLPAEVMEGAAQGFSAGWHNRYPPLHFYLLTAVQAPIRWLSAEPVVVSDASLAYERLFLAGRVVSLLMAAGCLLLLYACGRELGDRAAGLGAALVASLSVTFAYYARFANVDVPYCFWFLLALLFFLRGLRTAALGDLLGFAVAATLSLCTKDQAWALFALPALALGGAVARDGRLEGGRARSLADRRIVWPVLLAAILFASIHNLAFNAPGFGAHVRLIAGPLGEGYRMFDGGLDGQLQLLKLTLRNVVFALGGPASVLCFAGVGLALIGDDVRAKLALLPVLSYHLLFSAVVLYSYDRFVLPVCLVLSLYGGLLLARLAERGWPGRAAAAALGAIVLGFGALRCLGLGLLLVSDSRYAVEAWFRSRVPQEARIALLGPLEYLPRLPGFAWKQRTELVRAVEGMRPDYVVVNQAVAVRANDPRARDVYAGLASGALGYVPVLIERTPLAWPVRLDAELRAREGQVFSNIDKVDPEIRVYRRVSVPPR